MTQTTAQVLGADNAAAKINFIAALYELNCFTNQLKRDRVDVILSPEALEILDDYNVTVDDNDDAIDDAVWDALRADCLGVDYSATWSSGSDYNGEPQSFKVWLTVGGPSCYIVGDFGKHGIVDQQSLEVRYSWASESDYVRLTESETEAIAWYVEQVAV